MNNKAVHNSWLNYSSRQWKRSRVFVSFIRGFPSYSSWICQIWWKVTSTYEVTGSIKRAHVHESNNLKQLSCPLPAKCTNHNHSQWDNPELMNTFCCSTFADWFERNDMDCLFRCVFLNSYYNLHQRHWCIY